MFPRVVRLIDNPATKQRLLAKWGFSELELDPNVPADPGADELPFGASVAVLQWGEDGTGLGLVYTRRMTIAEQCTNGDFQDWFVEEQIASMLSA